MERTNVNHTSNIKHVNYVCLLYKIDIKILYTNDNINVECNFNICTEISSFTSNNPSTKRKIEHCQ